MKILQMFKGKPGNYILTVLICFFLAYTQLWEIVTNFKGQLTSNIEAALGVIQGTPHWKVYQSRLLGPYFFELVNNILGLGHSYAFLLTLFLQSFFMFLTVILTYKSISGSWLTSYGIAILSSFFVALLLQGKWLYLWDFFDFIFISLVIWSYYKEKSLLIIFSIITLAIFNRELSLIVLIWLALISGYKIIFKAENNISRYKKIFFVSIILLIAGYSVINYLREFLLIKELGPELFVDSGKNLSSSSFHFKFFNNLERFSNTIFNLSKNQIYNFIICSIAVISFLGAFSKKSLLVELSALLMIMLCSTLVFAEIYETRVWISLIPLVIFIFRELIQEYSL